MRGDMSSPDDLERWVHAIEDLCWQDPGLKKDGVPGTRDLLRRLQIDGVLESPVITEEQRRDIEENLERIYLFGSLSV